MKRKELLEALSETREALLEHYDLPPEDREKTYAPGKWTVREILAHLADAELTFLWRVSRGIAEPGCTLETMDPDQWAAKLDYDFRPILINKELFHSARSQLLYYIEALPQSRLEQEVHHPERGTMTIWQLIEYLAEHTRHHLEQIEKARNGSLLSSSRL